MLVFIVIILFSTSIFAQKNFFLKKEGNSIVAIYKPDNYSIIEDTVSSMLRVNQKNKYIDYYFRRTKMYNDQCKIRLYSRVSPVFDSLFEAHSINKINDIIYRSIKKTYSSSLWFKGKIISHTISPMQQHHDGYYYVDIFETTYQSDYSKYVSSMSRIFVINGIEHRISVYTKGYPYNKTVCSSRKAVCHVFEELVNSLMVELE